ncbi:MAG: hypothetical protein QNJ18_15850 [Xenococcaceae cyanobacterium MO_167.B52]|nr:hypothetical protein [Xenococcaceae cyanobacterium MO_167.B52]
MKFDVKYLTTNFNFQGKGRVFVNDTALIFQGNLPKFNVGPLAVLDQDFFYVLTSRTVPYASIIQYKKPSDLRIAHKIDYRIQNGKKIKIKFKMMIKSKKKDDEMFTSRLEEYLNVAQSFVSS